MSRHSTYSGNVLGMILAVVTIAIVTSLLSGSYVHWIWVPLFIWVALNAAKSLARRR